MLIALIFSESFLLKLTQSNLSRKNFDVDCKELATLLYDALNDFMMVEGHEKMKPTVAAISKNNSPLDILNTCNEHESNGSTSFMPRIEKYLQHYL